MRLKTAWDKEYTLQWRKASASTVLSVPLCDHAFWRSPITQVKRWLQSTGPWGVTAAGALATYKRLVTDLGVLLFSTVGKISNYFFNKWHSAGDTRPLTFQLVELECCSFKIRTTYFHFQWKTIVASWC